MKRIVSILSMALMMLMSLGTTSCYGSFVLTKKLHTGIGNLGNKWVSELVFLLCLIIPVYGIMALVDALVFNLVEFWSGNNPMALSDYDQNGTAIKEVKKDGVTLRMTYLNYGKEMHMDTFKKGIQQGKTVIVKQSEPGVIYKQEITGEISRVDQSSIDTNSVRYASAKLQVKRVLSTY